MLTFVKKYGYNYYSQNLEDGIIEECLKRMKIEKGLCVEFGAADGIYCSNTRRLLDKGWKGIMIEPDKDLFEKLTYNTKGLQCVVINSMVTPANVNQILPFEIEVLSIDTDGKNDYETWKEYSGSAKIVVVEINSSIDPLINYLDEGANYRTMYELGVMKGYFLLCHTGNLIFVRKDFRSLFPEVNANPIIDVELFFNKYWL